MTIKSLPRFPALVELRRLCRRVTRTTPEVMLAGHRLDIHEVRPHFMPAGYTVREHVHSYYEAHILLDGSALYTIGEPQVVRPGGALLHEPHAPHAWQESDTPCLRLLIWFDMEPPVPVPRPAEWPIWPDLLWDVDRVLHEAAGGHSGWQDRVSARLTVVLSRLLSIAGWPNSPRPAPMVPQMQWIPAVDQFLLDNLTRPLNLDDVALHVGVSKRSLCRHFLQLTGATVMERLSHLRMDRAATLLAETDAGLGEIGTQVGLPDPSYFCRRFRQHFHLTPQVYRRQMTGGTTTREE